MFEYLTKEDWESTESDDSRRSFIAMPFAILATAMVFIFLSRIMAIMGQPDGSNIMLLIGVAISVVSVIFLLSLLLDAMLISNIRFTRLLGAKYHYDARTRLINEARSD